MKWCGTLHERPQSCIVEGVNTQLSQTEFCTQSSARFQNQHHFVIWRVLIQGPSAPFHFFSSLTRLRYILNTICSLYVYSIYYLCMCRNVLWVSLPIHMPCKRRVEGHFKNSGEKRQNPEGNIHEIMSDFSRPTIFLNNFAISCQIFCKNKWAKYASLPG